MFNLIKPVAFSPTLDVPALEGVLQKPPADFNADQTDKLELPATRVNVPGLVDPHLEMHRWRLERSRRNQRNQNFYGFPQIPGKLLLDKYDPVTGLTKNEIKNKLPLPVQVKEGESVVIGNNFTQYQKYGGYGPYLHGGVDFCAPAGSEVVSMAPGIVEISWNDALYSGVLVAEIDEAT